MQEVIAMVLVLGVFTLNVVAATVATGLPFYAAVATATFLGIALIGTVIKNV